MFQRVHEKQGPVQYWAGNSSPTTKKTFTNVLQLWCGVWMQLWALHWTCIWMTALTSILPRRRQRRHVHDRNQRTKKKHGHNQIRTDIFHITAALCSNTPSVYPGFGYLTWLELFRVDSALYAQVHGKACMGDARPCCVDALPLRYASWSGLYDDRLGDWMEYLHV